MHESHRVIVVDDDDAICYVMRFLPDDADPAINLLARSGMSFRLLINRVPDTLHPGTYTSVSSNLRRPIDEVERVLVY
jgi:hypothetical protein